MVSENEFLIHALMMGLFFSFVYDLLRIARRVIKHNAFCVSVEDLGFWIYCGAEVFLLMYHESNGTLRWFAVMGALAGMLFYGKVISPFFVKYASMGLQKLLCFLAKCLKWLFAPLRILARKTEKGAKKAGRGIRTMVRKILRTIKKKLTYFLKMLKISLKH